jgi:hypothetical protein
MALNGTSVLGRIASNPRCERLVGMVLSGMSEPAFYRAVTTEPYPKEFGERHSARRRGSKFEDNLFANNAAKLCGVLNEIVGIDPSRMFVRNMDNEVPGAQQGTYVARWKRTRAIINSAMGGQIAHVVIHPVLHLTVPGSRNGQFWVVPDFMIWDSSRNFYVPGDAKSFVVLDNHVDPGDLDKVRHQLAAQVLALKEEAARVNAADRVGHTGYLVFSTPFGLQPHRPRREDVRGAIANIESALAAFMRHAAKIRALREVDGARYENLFLDLNPHFEERCVSTCVFADHCRQDHAGKARDLGDAAAQVFGPDADLSRLTALATGATQPTPEETKLAAQLQLIWQAVRPVRRVA